MRIFISGASGLIGGNCMKYFLEMGCEVMGTYHSFPAENTVFFDTVNVGNAANADLRSFAPDVILHCGALTHVDYCESHEEESYQKTVLSTVNLLKFAEELHAKLVYISTDYVFDGRQGPYSEEDEQNPLSVYARHKAEAEKLVLSHSKKNIVLRVTNVYGTEVRNKNFIARIIEQCREGIEMTFRLPHDQYATPVLAFDVARALYLLLRDEHSGVFHIASTDLLNRVELALKVLGYFPDAIYKLEYCSTEALRQDAPRPLKGGLLKNKFSEHYPEFIFTTVDRFMQGITEAVSGTNANQNTN